MNLSFKYFIYLIDVNFRGKIYFIKSKGNNEADRLLEIHAEIITKNQILRYSCKPY